MEADLPRLFNMGILREPDRDPVQKWLENRTDRAFRKRKEGGRANINYKFGY